MARPQITQELYTDEAAFEVFRVLDARDRSEAQVARGRPLSLLALFADWRAAQADAMLSLVFRDGATGRGHPFAVLGLIPAGQAGVAQAGFLAANHAIYRRQIAEAAARIRDGLTPFAARAGLHRIEARSWAGHPSAARFLASVGFHHECDMPGFGSDGTATFRQFAWVAPGHHQGD